MANKPMMRDRNEIAKNRPKRVPIHEQRNQMTTEQRPGFVRRWVNDIPGRVEKFLKAGYELVSDKDVTVGDETVTDNNVALGSGARKNVGRTRSGEGTQAVLMEISAELYEEDQKAKQAQVNASEEALKRNIRENDFYGDIKQSASMARKKKTD